MERARKNSTTGLELDGAGGGGRDSGGGRSGLFDLLGPGEGPEALRAELFRAGLAHVSDILQEEELDIPSFGR